MIELDAEQRRLFRAMLSSSNSNLDIVTLARTISLDPTRFFAGGDWRGVDFGKHNLAGFDFRGADLRRAKMLNNAGLEEILIDSKTKLPGNLVRQFATRKLRGFAESRTQGRDEVIDAATSEDAISPRLSGLLEYLKTFSEQLDYDSNAAVALLDVLNEISDEYCKIGRFSEALAMSSRAINVFRMRRNEYRYGGVVAIALLAYRNQSRILSELRDDAGSLRAIEAAVELVGDYKKLLWDSRELFFQNAMVQVDLAKRRASVGRHRAAYYAARDGVKALEDLVQDGYREYLPDLARATEVQSRALASMGQFRDAISSIQDAITLYEANLGKADMPNLMHIALCRYDAANWHATLGNLNSALSLIEMPVQTFRDSAVHDGEAHRPYLGEALVLLARLHERKDNLQAALQTSAEALEIFAGLARTSFEHRGTYASILVQRGRLLALSGHIQDAIATSENAVKLLCSTPENIKLLIEALLNLGQLLRQNDNHIESLHKLEQSIELSSHPSLESVEADKFSVLTRTEQAITLHALRRYGEAEESFSEALTKARRSRHSRELQYLQTLPYRYLKRYRKEKERTKKA
ncbi:hypothetical protein [Ciceribacter sp. L1K22]|uniref:hypothetical protein n=1 Tax=Ciceribacter sp. L1K22 TaxID=2820275 RepID=UPI001ABE47CD|nr:hypothetical protein [Ciceribacter sp. L1K22]MBO3760363.1 hypothetical protein [Ciceribacter sp. L1K22]